MTTDETDAISIDWSGVRSDQVRSRLEDALRQLGRSPDPSVGFWRSLERDLPASKWRNFLVLADLSECVRQFRSVRPHVWASYLRTCRPLILGLVRSERDRRFTPDVDRMVRTSGGRLLVCELNAGSTEEATECLGRALAGLDPNAVTDVRYSVEEGCLWLEFGDGLEGSLRWDGLPLGSASSELRPETATRATSGSSVEVLRKSGEVFDIDASSLRAMLDAAHARRLGATAAVARTHLGTRLRMRRNASGVTQTELAGRTGLEQSLISKLESGRHHPRYDTLERYAEGLGMTVPELVG